MPASARTSARSSTRVIVVGAGVGGLASAMRLAAAGFEVLLLESAAQPGGKMRELTLGGAAIDAGPTVFTMRWVFEELFESAGTRLADHLVLRPLEVLARHAWSEHERLDLFADVRASAHAIGEFAGPQASRGYLDFCARARRIHDTLEAPFLRGSRPNPLSLAARVGLRGLPELARIAPLATMWNELGRHFADPRLRQLFGRYATYCGSSPFQAPATLMLVAHVEQQGVWCVEGGMHRVAQAMVAVARQHGASLRCNAMVDSLIVRDGRVCGVRLADGEELAAGAVVFNGDAAALADGRLGAAARRAVAPVAQARRSLSAVTWNLLAPTAGFPLSHHTVFFSKDCAREFDDLARGRLPGDPTVYVCAQDRLGECGGGSGSDGSDGSSSGSGCHNGASPAPGPPERMLWIVNAPATGDSRPFTHEELSRCEARTLHTMERCGLSVKRRPEATRMTTPQDFERLFPATGGALYGQASHGWAASFRRPGARSRLPGLYLAGGSVHPGPGVPMAALSGHQAAASVMEDLARSSSPRRPSTLPSSATDTPGGISMR